MNKQITNVQTLIWARANLSWLAAIVALVAIMVGVAWPTSLAAQNQPSLDLSSLSVTDQNGTTVSIGTFDPATTTYSGSVDSTVESINIDAIASAGSSADVQIIPRDSQAGISGHQVELSHGTNLILVSVDSYSIDAVLNTYAVQINRGGAAATGTANVVSISVGEYRAREGSTVPFLLTRTGDTTQELTVQIEISERYNNKVPTSFEGRFDVEFEAGHASARHDVETMGDSLTRGTSSVEGRVRSGSGYTVGTNSGTLVWQVWDDDYGTLNLKSIVVNDMSSNYVDIGTFDPAEKSYSATVASTEEYVTVSAAKPLQGWRGTFIVPGDSEPDVSGHQVALSHGTNLIAVGVYSNALDEKELSNIYELKIERSGTATPGSPINVGVNGPNSANEGAMLPFLLTRTGDTSQSLTVQFDVTETGGDMVSGMYEGQKDVEFLAGEAFAKHYIGTMADEVWEERSTVTVQVKEGTGYQVSQSAGSASTLVEDNDLPDMTAVLTLDSTEADEGDHITATVTVTTDGPQIPHEHAGTLVIKTSIGTAGEDDFELNDFGYINHLDLHAQGAFKPVKVDGKITAFQAKLSVTIEILDDYRAEPDEIFYVLMKDRLLTDGVTMDPNNTKHTVTIRGEDETPPVPSEAGYVTVVVTDSGTTGSAFTISWHDPAGCDSDYSARLKGGFTEFPLIVLGLGPNGWDFSGNIVYQDIGSTSTENTEIVGTLEYISTTIYLEYFDRYAHTDGLSVIVDCVGSHVVAEIPLPSQSADTVERPKPGTYSSEAPLTGLTISSGTLSPAFNKDGFLYSVLDVPNEDEQVTFTATAKSGYSISWGPTTDADPDTDGHQVDLDVGYNTIYATAESDEVIHSEGIHSTVYEVIVKRTEETLVSGQQQVDATLSALNLSGIDLSFDPATTEYTVEVENGVTETTVTPEANNPGSTFVIKLDGVEDNDGTVSLSAGNNVITIDITPAGGGTIQTYTVTIIRQAPIPDAQTREAPGTPPDTPDRPTGTAVFVGGVDLEWNDVAGAESYDVQMYRNGQWTDLPGDGIETALYGAGAIISGLDPESTLWFRVRASNSHGSSDWSAWNQMPSTNQSTSGRRSRPDNVPASGEPAINGAAQVGESLSADTMGIEDGNGLDRVQFRFQWVSHDGSADTDIANATDSTYALVADDEGKTIKVRVAFTDRGGYAESLTGGETATVAALPNSPATGAPAITGTAQVGETLTADTSGISDADGLTNVSYSYQWVANDGNADTDITNATDSTYTLAAAEEGKSVKVTVSFTDDIGNEESLTSTATEEVEARPNTPANGAPTISGTAQVGETLTADTTDIADADGLSGATFSYQWVANDGTSDTDIAGATSSRYGVTLAELQKTLKVRVSFTDDRGTEETVTSVATQEVRWPNLAAYGKPVVLGTLEVGQTLTADVSGIRDGNGLTNATFAYYWWRCSGPGHREGEEYTLMDGDEGFSDCQLTVYFYDDAGYLEHVNSDVIGVVAPRANSPATGAPVITGTAQVGETLTADTTGIADTDGLTNVSYNYQWIRTDGSTDTDIMSATDSTYTLVANDDGKTIKVRVSFTDDAGYDETLTSAATDEVSFAVQQQVANSPATGALTISGTAQVGEILTADTSGITDADGLTNVSYTYQWVAYDGTADADIPNATDSTYTLVADDEGKTMKVRVSFTDDVNNDESLTSSATSTVEAVPNTPATGAPAISGVAQVGETLTADTSGITDADGLTNVSYSYQWVANDGTADTDIADATGSSYTLVAADEGNTISVHVSFTDDANNNESLTSSATATVEAVPNTPATGAPAISGVAQVGETLTADTSGITDADGLTNVSYSYQWIRNDGTSDTDIADVTAATYTLIAADEGNTISVRVSFTDDSGNEEELSSAATAAVAASEPPAKPTGLSTVSVFHDGVSLTWDDHQDDSITGYVILRRDPEIHPSGTFVAITADTGSVNTTYTDDTVEPETRYVYRIQAINEYGAVSGRSHWIVANTPAVPVPAKPTGLSTVSVSHDGVSLTWDNPQDDSITGYVVLRRDPEIHSSGTFVTITADTGSGNTTYTDDTVEPETRYVYRIQAINNHGKSERSHWIVADTPAAPAG